MSSWAPALALPVAALALHLPPQKGPGSERGCQRLGARLAQPGPSLGRAWGDGEVAGQPGGREHFGGRKAVRAVKHVDAIGEKTPAPEKCAAKVGEPFGALETREPKVQNTDFIINNKNPQGIYGSA